MWKFEEIKRANGNLTEGPVWDGKVIIFTDGLWVASIKCMPAALAF